MNGSPHAGLPARLFGIIVATAIMVGLVFWAGLSLLAPRPGTPMTAAATPWPAERPIPAEAGVFRTRPGDLAADPGARRRDEAHPRTMAMYQRLRAFPGAPPRIPHGLTNEEFRGGRCHSCHERGGYVERFAAYAPVTPHPELAQCLQCHVPDYDLVGLPLPDDSRGSVCFQCHVLDADRPLFAPLEWPAPAWPETRRPALPGGPPPIPHGLQLRENCLACHMGAGAVEAIRTTHPERANCRQCHVTSTAEPDVFVRAATGTSGGAGGGS